MYTPADLRALSIDPVENSAAQKIYTTYAGEKDVLLLPKLLEQLAAILIDVRFAPPLRPLKWNKDYLKLLLKRKYLHVPALGDRSRAGAKPLVQNLALGMKIIPELKINVLLFCACADDKTCHRHQITKEFTRHGREVTETSDWHKILF